MVSQMRRQSKCNTNTFVLTLRFFAILVAICMAVLLTGCTRQSKTGFIVANDYIGAMYSDGKPAIGPTVEKESVINIDISTQTRLNINMQKGSVKITRGSQEHLQLIEKTRLQGPASKERLNEYLSNIISDVENNYISVSINHKAYLKADEIADEQADENAETSMESNEEEEIKPLYRCTIDMELVVPEKIKAINVNAENAVIILSGLEDMSVVDLSVDRGLVRVDNCSSNNFSVSVDNGDIWMENITGYSTYDCGRGDIVINGAKGDVDLELLAGETIIEGAKGKLDCNISSGSLKITESVLENGTMLYASTGEISADLNYIDEKGTYTIKSSAGDVLIDLPQNTGWSLIAKSTRGRIKNNLEPNVQTLETGSDGEVYGDVNGGGALVDIYTDRGKIILN